MIEDIFLLLVFLSALCGALGAGAYITDVWIPKRRLQRRLDRLTRGVL